MDPLPLSALNDYLYCERRAHLKFVDGLRGTNEHTLLGDLAHEAVDTPGYEHRAGWELLRALPLFSDKLGLSGKADLVEIRRDPASSARVTEARPVEYKKGPARRWSNDHAQLCAQALCLEEMFGLQIESGLIFHAASALRTEVIFDVRLIAPLFGAGRGLKRVWGAPKRGANHRMLVSNARVHLQRPVRSTIPRTMAGADPWTLGRSRNPQSLET